MEFIQVDLDLSRKERTQNDVYCPTLSSNKHEAYTVLFGLKLGALIANHIREFCYSSG